QADAAGERVDRAFGLALVDQHVVQAGTQVPDDDQQESDDQQRLERVAHAWLRAGLERRIIRPRGCRRRQARAGPRLSRRGALVLGWTLALLAAAAFAALGRWQLARMQQKQAMLDAAGQVLQAREAQPLSAAADPRRARAYDWAEGEGRFADAPAVLLDNQSRHDRPGVRAYRLFEASDGTRLLVELGWLPLPG